MKVGSGLFDERGATRETARCGREDYGRGTGLAPEQVEDETEHPYCVGLAAA